MASPHTAGYLRDHRQARRSPGNADHRRARRARENPDRPARRTQFPANRAGPDHRHPCRARRAPAGDGRRGESVVVAGARHHDGAVRPARSRLCGGCRAPQSAAHRLAGGAANLRESAGPEPVQLPALTVLLRVRFSSVVSNIASTSENFSASRSRIQDADFAKETANLTRGQILQQAGTAILSQANSAPQSVLSLLR